MKQLLLLFGLILGTTLFAQEFPYDFEVLTETYTPLDNAVEITGDESWDDPAYALPLGFTFEFMGSSGDQLYISPLTLGGGIGFTNEYISPQDILVLYGSDLIDVGYPTDTNLSKISIQVDGMIGSRIAKVQWEDCGFYNEVSEFGTSSNRFNMQAWFYEGSSDFEIRFGPHSIKANDIVHDDGNPWIGFVDDINLFTEEIAGSWFLQGSITEPSITFIEDVNQIFQPPMLSNNPYEGLVYRFTNQNVSVEENLLKEMNVNVYPNPVEDVLNIQLNALSSNSYMDVLDMSGRILHSQKLYNLNTRLDCSDWSSGIYFVKINSGAEVRTVKFVKK